MADIKVGDEVRVFDINGRRMGQPEGGWTGKVVKVGRTLAHIEYGYGGRASAFRLDSGRINDNNGHKHFETLEQVALNARRSHALEVLRLRKVRLENDHPFTLEQIEALADFISRL